MDSAATPRLVDTHAHLDEPAFDADRDAVIAATRSVGVWRIINIGYSPVRWTTSVALRDRHPDIAIALGLHPQLAAEFGPGLQRDLERAITDWRPVAIGETGFDFFRSSPVRGDQERAFRAQIALAGELQLPIIIHQREASDALIAELDRERDLASIVLHSFEGTPRLAQWAIERGCYIGIGGLAAKPASIGLRGLLEAVPIDRVLLETDSPYLAPPGAPRRNIPANLPAIADLVAPIWAITGQELSAIASANACKLFTLKCERELRSRVVG